jgi:hypothetical protein
MPQLRGPLVHNLDFDFLTLQQLFALPSLLFLTQQLQVGLGCLRLVGYLLQFQSFSDTKIDENVLRTTYKVISKTQQPFIHQETLTRNNQTWCASEERFDSRALPCLRKTQPITN